MQNSSDQNQVPSINNNSVVRFTTYIVHVEGTVMYSNKQSTNTLKFEFQYIIYIGVVQGPLMIRYLLYMVRSILTHRI